MFVNHVQTAQFVKFRFFINKSKICSLSSSPKRTADFFCNPAVTRCTIKDIRYLIRLLKKYKESDCFLIQICSTAVHQQQKKIITSGFRIFNQIAGKIESYCFWYYFFDTFLLQPTQLSEPHLSARSPRAASWAAPESRAKSHSTSSEALVTFT